MVPNERWEMARVIIHMNAAEFTSSKMYFFDTVQFIRVCIPDFDSVVSWD
jgi:hypothetical protein